MAHVSSYENEKKIEGVTPMDDGGPRGKGVEYAQEGMDEALKLEQVMYKDLCDDNDKESFNSVNSPDNFGMVELDANHDPEGFDLVGELFEKEEEAGKYKQIQKSSRHSRITGDFAEHIVLYWLSKYGYECARIDHVGVDLIARRPSGNLTMGISVKSRSREKDLSERAPGLIKKKDILRLTDTCRIFQWTPYVAFVVDSPNKMFMVMCSLRKYLSFNKTTFSFRPQDIIKYKNDSELKIIEFDHVTSLNW